MRAFFEAIWQARPGFGEIRTIRDGKVQQAYFPAGLDGFAEQYALEQSWYGADVYFGVLRRVRESGTAADVEPWTQVLWADVDAKKQSDVLSEGKAMALAAINALPIPPQIVVDSGGGYHAYWRLHQPEDLERAQHVMRWVADEVQGDRVMDAPRILRVPGTLNRKRAVPVPCRLLRMDLDRRVRLSDFEALVPVKLSVMSPLDGSTRLPRIRQDLPEWLSDLVDSSPPQGTRSEQIFRAVIWLLRYGRTPVEVKDIIRIANIGEKYREKSGFDGERYLDYVLAAADRIA